MPKDKSNLPATTDNQNEITSDLVNINDEVNNTGKLDVGKALKMRMTVPPMSYQKIGDKFGVSNVAVFKALKPFTELLKNPAGIAAYRENKANLIDAAQMQMLSEIVNEDKVKKATLGNVAYAISQLDNVARLERGQTTSHVEYHILNESVRELEAEEAKIREQLEGN